jgi:hypothetical protein
LTAAGTVDGLRDPAGASLGHPDEGLRHVGGDVLDRGPKTFASFFGFAL